MDRGFYAEQLERWFEAFPQEQVLMASLEQFKADWKREFKRVIDFLELPSWIPPEFEKVYSRKYDRMDAQTRKQLIETFRPHNQRLYKLLGREFDWDC